MQWAAIAPGMVVVATDDRAWLHRPGPGGIGDAFSEPMSGPGTMRSTRHLLDGALAAARRTVPAAPAGPCLTVRRWAWRLAWQYHTTHATPLLLTEARERFRALGRAALVECCARQIEEESGHDELALRDLRALGYRAEAVVHAIEPPSACAIVDYFSQCVRSENPIKFLGYTYALERSAMSVSRDYVEAVEAVLPPDVFATRCLRVHSAIGSDVSHVAETVELIAGLRPDERALIARACFETTLIMHTTRPGDDPPEEELEALLAPLQSSQESPSTTEEGDAHGRAGLE